MKNKEKAENKKLRCSFCGRSQSEVGELVHGVNGYICKSCALTVAGIFREIDKKEEKAVNVGEIASKTPKTIKKELNKFVIGQDFAKKVVSVAIYNHYKRIKYNLKNDIPIRKSNLLFFGPTGVGKTLMAETIARFIDVPFAIADATSVTEAGYVGEDVENILLKLVENANYNIKKAELGIIYVDEIDKIAKLSSGPSITRDVSGEGVQQALLKIIESTVANIPPKGGRKHPEQEYIKLKTDNILFIFGGAFVGLDEIVRRRTGKKNLGFGHEIRSITEFGDIKNAQPEDFIKYGLIPEFIGRIPILVPFDNLDEEKIIRIMKEPKNAILKEYQTIMSLDNLEIEWEDDAIEYIARKVKEKNTGARGIKSIIESVLIDVMFRTPSITGKKKCIIKKEDIEKGKSPKIIRIK
ncbi:MAG: ATP-dependent Clp protease ATP-binding subunit ClpX [Proteobacteria bacterium]|nr:ATP-dependent Clp protease ATP-binding subunit ClpX [Pseudomonadota bacterium]